MKKLVLLLVVLMTSITLFGQTSKGNLVVSGGTGLQFISSNVKSVYDGKTEDEYTVSSFSLIPFFGYFVMDNLALGLSSTFSNITQKYESGNKYISSSVLIIPTALYYFTVDEKIKPLAQIGIGYSTLTSKYIPKTGSDDKNSGSGLVINFGGGISYFVSKNISFNLGLSYTMSTLTDGDDDKSKLKQGNFGSNIGISVFF